ncbi:MAG: hypothetical protein J0H08_16410 [Rhizobiales bacterium]|nr:hypothetical protein [Hyphomicrobiales bacterium]
MPLPKKRWFRIADVAKRWEIPPSDVEDYALDEILRLSVVVVDLAAEAGICERDDHTHHHVLEDMPILNGPQPLCRTSLLSIFRDGLAEVGSFRTERPGGYVRVASGVPAVIVRREDLIVTREERDRFEGAHNGGADANQTVSDAWHNDDFTSVRVDNEWHSFGPKQAAVLRLLKAAAETDNPWRDGKRLLDDAGATTIRLIDLFKRKPAWRRLVLADGKGRYRLNAEFLSPERRRIRLFRKSGPGGASRRDVGIDRRAA